MARAVKPRQLDYLKLSSVRALSDGLEFFGNRRTPREFCKIYLRPRLAAVWHFSGESGDIVRFLVILCSASAIEPMIGSCHFSGAAMAILASSSTAALTRPNLRS
jgi:hypothetical protein